MRRVFTAAILCLSILSIGVYAQQAEAPLTNSSVIKLVKAGFKEKTIIAIIGNRPGDFDVDTDHLIHLKRNGVNENIILAMLSSHLGTSIDVEDEWSSNDTFFKDLKRPNAGGDSEGQGASIFGSGGSSQSQTRSRGGSGGNQTEGNLSGSATVRIIKSPVEGGESGSPRLVKTPTLNNEGVIRLVGAGFSEGTIIKRIEESPVDFDLSPARINDLQKRRVSESIIAAMNAAMGK